MMETLKRSCSIVLRLDMTKNSIRWKGLKTWRTITFPIKDVIMHHSFASICVLIFFVHHIFYSFTKCVYSGKEFEKLLKDRWAQQVKVVDVKENEEGSFTEILYKDGTKQWELVSSAMKETCSKC